MEALQQLIDADFDLPPRLFSARIITKDEMDMIIHRDLTSDRRSRVLLELMSVKSHEERRRFLNCLENTMQKHVVNYIRGNKGE
jgi:Caspase recruitment domain